jgi:AraC-like DNA-binding protein
MNYQTFRPHADLESLVKCHWTLEVPAEQGAQRQRIIPDGCMEMVFILGDDIKRYISDDEFVIQPRAMVLGQITGPFYVEPVGKVDSFAVRFYPYGFSNFVAIPIQELADKETPIRLLFGDKRSQELERKIIQASDTKQRIEVVENFLREMLEEKPFAESLVNSTVDALFLTRGSASISAILKDDLSKRRQLERDFLKQVGLSPKQLGKVIRLQAALKMMLNRKSGNLTQIAYESEYYDQAHFTKDFREFTGMNPKEFFGNGEMALSSLIYKKS